jgi:hypothetical protein
MSSSFESGLSAPASDDEVRGYLAHLDDIDLDEAKKLEFLRVLFAMMRTFVELGFDVRGCGQILEAFNELSQDESGALDSKAGEKEDA